MFYFLTYLIVINLTAFLLLAITHRFTQTPDGCRRSARARNIRGNNRQPTGLPAVHALTILMPLFAFAGGSVSMLLGLILWERNVNKHNVAWWFEAAVGLVAWGMVCTWRYSLVSFGEAGLFRAFNPAVLRALGIYLLVMNCITLLVFAADKRIAIANGDAPRSRSGGSEVSRAGGRNRSRVPESWLLGLSFLGGALGGIIAMRCSATRLGIGISYGAARIRSVTDCAVPVPACRRSVLERAARSMLVCLDDRGTTRLGNKNGADPRCRQSNALRGCLGFQGVRKAGRRRPCRCRLELKQPVLEAISICWRLLQ